MRIWKILLFVVLLLLTACHSSKSTMGGDAGQEHTEMAKMRKVVANAQRASCVTARVNVELSAKGKDIAVGGRLRMKKDEVIQLSLSLLGFEVGRMEFTPQHVLVVDRVNKQYVKASYHMVSFLRQADLDFYALQSLFWNELFVPGQRPVSDHLSRFHYAATGDYALLTLPDTPKLVYTFQIQTQPSIINSVMVKGKNTTDEGQLDWTYDNFVRLDNRYFPSVMRCQVKGLNQEMGLTLSLSSLNNDEGWSTETKISSRYRERSVEEILRQLMAM